jgi:endonuclease/exonuclease/phosphatase family metal-dependent hydrolase
MAICVLKIKSLPEQHNTIVVASVHNYSGRGWSGRGSEENYASLLFDFLSKLPRNIPVIVAGDFNFDIRCPALTQSYHVPSYDLRPLREGLRTIDFIVVTKSEDDAELQVSVSKVQAHDFLLVDRKVRKIRKIKDQRKITNHSPVSAVIELDLK